MIDVHGILGIRLLKKLNKDLRLFQVKVSKLHSDYFAPRQSMLFHFLLLLYLLLVSNTIDFGVESKDGMSLSSPSSAKGSPSPILFERVEVGRAGDYEFRMKVLMSVFSCFNFMYRSVR